MTCAFEGQPTLPPDLMIYDKPVGGAVVGRFTGGPSGFRIGDLPGDASTSRAQVATGIGTGGFRLVGYVEVAKVPFFTTRRVAANPDHLWIGAQREVRVVGAHADEVEVEKRLTEPLRQTFRALVPCGALALVPRSPPDWSVPGNARGYVVAKDQMELYDQAGRDRALVTVLNLANGMLLWSQEARDGLVHVQYHGEIVLDAWAKEGHLRALPPGETLDVAAAPTRRPGSPQLRIADVPREVVTKREVTLRAGAGDGAAVIGTIEPNTPTYILDMVAGWVSVLPKSLHVAPPNQGQFWASAADLGVRRPTTPGTNANAIAETSR
ncbi:MAG: hypothetical protein JW751_14820 [Polyangiaceae bacterium]|nr:hypothetical protein [Polyangiaceae bacterium]